MAGRSITLKKDVPGVHPEASWGISLVPRLGLAAIAVPADWGGMWVLLNLGDAMRPCVCLLYPLPLHSSLACAPTYPSYWPKGAATAPFSGSMCM